jgi:hypothetical protein
MAIIEMRKTCSDLSLFPTARILCLVSKLLLSFSFPFSNITTRISHRPHLSSTSLPHLSNISPQHLSHISHPHLSPTSLTHISRPPLSSTSLPHPSHIHPTHIPHPHTMFLIKGSQSHKGSQNETAQKMWRESDALICS